MITLELPDGTKRPTPITDIDSIRVARGGTDLPELARLGVIVTYTDGTFDAVVGTFTELCAAIAAATPKARAPDDVLTDPQPGAVWTEYAAWPDGFITDIDDTGRATLDASENRDSIVRVWAFEPPKSYQHACELAAASDVPPPTP